METEKVEENAKQIQIDKEDITKYVLALENEIEDKVQEIDSLNKAILVLKKDNSNLNSTLDQKEISYNSLNNDLALLKSQNKILEEKIKTLEAKEQEQNNKIVELTQKNKSLNDNITLLQKNASERDIILKISKIQNRLDEVETQKGKIEFEKQSLINKINEMKIQNETEIKLNNLYKQSEIAQYQKQIAYLQSTINEMTPIINGNQITSQKSSNSSQYLLSQLSAFEDQISKLNEENYEIKKKNKALKSQAKENEIKLTHSDDIISSLQKKVELYDNTLAEARQRTEETFQKFKEGEDQIGQLFAEKEKLKEQNMKLQEGLRQVNEEAIKANDLLNQKVEEFAGSINKQKAKIKDYRERITKLKKKVDELLEENSRLKQENTSVKEALDIIDRDFHKANQDYLSAKLTQQSKIRFQPPLPQKTTLNKSQIAFRPISINDSLSENQKQTIEEYKKTLSRVDSNLKQYNTQSRLEMP